MDPSAHQGQDQKDSARKDSVREDSPEREFRRLARERASEQNLVRMRSVLSVHGALRTGLRMGSIAPSDRLEESVLVRKYSVSRNAVRAALRLLVEEGVVSRAPRAGTVILCGLADVRIDNGVAWARAEDADHELVTTESRWIPSTPVTRTMLGTDSAQVHCTEMVDLLDGRPSLLYTRFCLAPGTERPSVSGGRDGSFETLFAQTYGTRIGSIDCWVEAKGADERAAAQLGVAPGTALLVKSRQIWGEDGVPREYSVTHYLASRVALTTVLEGASTHAPTVVPRVRFERGGPAAPTGPAEQGPPAHRRSVLDVHSELRAAIRGGLFRVDEQLVEDDLAREFSTSRNTVRAALAQLVDEGLIRRDRRHGTVVVVPIAELTIDNAMGWSPEDTGRHRTESISAATIPTPPIVGERLGTDCPTVSVGHFLSRRDGRPFVIYIRYSEPVEHPRPLTNETRVDFDDLFRHSYGVSLDRIETSVHAVRAGDRAAGLLGVAPGTLLLLKERLLVGEDGRAREFSHSYYVAAGVVLSTRRSASAQARAVRSAA
ncbi:DNA-binding transcriptional regulator, GntR family [Rathayibacter oskolensis]|uniref:DNA-binding transcriptional regulator, GntR family n=1 Tax=Rathayibacter oskolensis TaxID=1891671 RepID=A0A1X7PDW9_9MICO|nr:GntR family transcriptional regulator [Rathayibacter oskolensis]SMH49489.1 DNA-binding transcriptional regulator, GntR family [Rathayibacter oskolensis]